MLVFVCSLYWPMQKSVNNINYLLLKILPMYKKSCGDYIVFNCICGRTFVELNVPTVQIY